LKGAVDGGVTSGGGRGVVDRGVREEVGEEVGVLVQPTASVRAEGDNEDAEEAGKRRSTSNSPRSLDRLLRRSGGSSHGRNHR
jgi:hypothetical protein